MAGAEVVNANMEVESPIRKESTGEKNGTGRDTKKDTLNTEKKKKNQHEDKARKSVEWDKAPWTQKHLVRQTSTAAVGTLFSVDHTSLRQVGPALLPHVVWICFEYCYSDLQLKIPFPNRALYDQALFLLPVSAELKMFSPICNSEL